MRIERCAVLAAALAAACAHAQPSDCRPVSAPQVIRDSGCYRLVSDIAVEAPGQPGLAVYADRVEIDLDGHRIAARAADTLGVGVHVMGAREVAVRGGAIDGFLFGIKIEPYGERGVEHALVEGVTIDGAAARGVSIKAADAVVRGNTIRNLRGYRGWPGSYTMAIELLVTSCKVAGNRISEVYPEGIGEAVAISLNDTTLACTIELNIAKNAKRAATGRSIGIWVGTSAKPKRRPVLAIERNTITGYDYAFFAPRELRRAVTRNDFAVFCPPRDRANTYGKALKCVDTPAELRKLAAQGDATWAVRLAQAYIEQVWTGDFPWTTWAPPATQPRCADYRRARDLLDPLVAKGDVNAKAQRARLAPLMQGCDG